MYNKKANYIVSLILALIILIVSACSCGSDDNDDSQSNSLSSSENVANLPHNSSDAESKSESSKPKKNVAKLPQNDESSKSAAGSTESSKPNSGTNGSSKPAVGSSEGSKTTSGSSESSKPATGSTESSKPNSGSSGNSKPSSGSSGNSKPSSGSSGNSKPTSGSNSPSKPAAHSHSYTTSVTAPTCTAKGYTTYTCNCGDSYKSDYKDVIDHTWCDWYTYLEPTYTSEGLERRECLTCGKTDERALAKIEATAYYLTADDKAEIISRLIAMGESYGLKYYPEATGPDGATWDSPTSVYEEELYEGRDYMLNILINYCEADFINIKETGIPYDGFGLDIIEYPNTRTGAYYEVYVYWV